VSANAPAPNAADAKRKQDNGNIMFAGTGMGCFKPEGFVRGGLPSFKTVGMPRMAMVLLATLLAGCASRVLEIDDIEPLRVQAISASSPEIIKLSGLIRHSTLGISRVETAQTGEILQVRVYAALVSDANPNGDLDYALEVPASVERIVFGNKKSVIWN
jgi:hypothetical protein